MPIVIEKKGQQKPKSVFLLTNFTEFGKKADIKWSLAEGQRDFIKGNDSGQDDIAVRHVAQVCQNRDVWNR